MFGYVKAHKPQLKICEYEAYRAAYCGLCRAMKKTTRAPSCLILNYDFVFLCLVRSVLEGEELKYEQRRCILHPIKKRPMLSLTPTLAYSAKASVELAYYKAEDDIRDSSRGRRIALRAVFPFFKYIKKHAHLPLLESVIQDRLSRLSQLESEKCASIDAPASVFGELLGEVFAHGLKEKNKLLAYETGYHTGKFIYAADAADDYERDAKKGNYNPLVLTYPAKLSQDNKNSIKTALLLELSYLERAIDLMDFSCCKDVEGIIKNIIYLGMPEVMSRALDKDENTIRKDEKQK